MTNEKLILADHFRVLANADDNKHTSMSMYKIRGNPCWSRKMAKQMSLTKQKPEDKPGRAWCQPPVTLMAVPDVLDCIVVVNEREYI